MGNSQTVLMKHKPKSPLFCAVLKNALRRFYNIDFSESCGERYVFYLVIILRSFRFQIPSSTIWKRLPGTGRRACNTFAGPPDSRSPRSRRSIGISRRNARPASSGKTRSAESTRSSSHKEVRVSMSPWEMCSDRYIWVQAWAPLF